MLAPVRALGSELFVYSTAFKFISEISFFGRKNFIEIKILQTKYSVGIIDMIKLRNIYNTYTYIPIYIQLNTHIYM